MLRLLIGMKTKRIEVDKITFVICIGLLSGILRYLLREDVSGDYTAFLEPWYEMFRQNGIAALSQQVGDYNLPYQTWILLMTWLPLKPLYAYKLVSCIFDYLLAAVVGLLVYELRRERTSTSEGADGFVGIIAYGIVLFFPQVWIDSAHWAQCDAIYTFWVVLAVLLYVMEKWSAALFVLGIALSFKLQAVFVIPFFLIAWFVWHRHSFWKFLWMLPGFYLFCIPAILCGRSWLAPFNIYLNQTTEYSAIRFNFPSFWGMVFPAGTHDEWNRTAVLLTLTVLAAGVWNFLRVRRSDGDRLDGDGRGRATALSWPGSGRKCWNSATCTAQDRMRQELWIRTVCWSIWTCVLLLPNMHERYAYSLDILMIVLLLTFEQLQDVPAAGLCWLCSLVCYGTARLELPYSTDLFRLTCGLYTAAYCTFSRTLFMRDRESCRDLEKLRGKAV